MRSENGGPMIVVSVAGVLLIVAVCQARDVAFMSTPELIKNQQFPLETHEVVTTDGYILAHYRIPHGKGDPGNRTRWPVLVQHGLVGDSSSWVNHNSEQVNSLGFLLAERGYDVWLLNSRGSRYARGHAFKGFFSPSYFDFSYHEMGMYDLPETIDYILAKTGANQVAHIGHSQGNTQMWVMLSERPEYNSKVALHISYGPVAYHTHSKNALYRFLSYFERWGFLSTKPARSVELPRGKLLTHLLVLFCGNWTPTRKICEWMYYWMMGHNTEQLNRTELRNIYGHYPASSTLKQFTHLIQSVNRPVFAQFDYKYQGNKQRYHSEFPPLYNLSNVLIPVYSFYGGVDYFCQLPDVNRLHGELPNLRAKYYIEHWAHYDFLYGIDAITKVYEPTIEILDKNLS